MLKHPDKDEVGGSIPPSPTLLRSFSRIPPRGRRYTRAHESVSSRGVRGIARSAGQRDREDAVEPRSLPARERWLAPARRARLPVTALDPA